DLLCGARLRRERDVGSRTRSGPNRRGNRRGRDRPDAVRGAVRRAVGRPAATRGGRSVRVSAGRLSLAALLSLGLAFPLAPVAAAQAAADAALAETRQRFARMGELLDPSGFDVDALALELAFEEPDDIAAWVDDNGRYEAYDGVLRGPTGTLVAGAGNALDQAVLLARLLGDAGFDARVALGTLGEEDAG